MGKVSFTLTIAALIAAVGLVRADAATLRRAQGEFRTFLSSLEYEPGRYCVKPYRPYDMDEWAREQYIRGGERYLTCLRTAADADMLYAQEIIEEGYNEAAQDFLNEVKRGY